MLSSFILNQVLCNILYHNYMNCVTLKILKCMWTDYFSWPIRPQCGLTIPLMVTKLFYTFRSGQILCIHIVMASSTREAIPWNDQILEFRVPVLLPLSWSEHALVLRNKAYRKLVSMQCLFKIQCK